MTLKAFLKQLWVDDRGQSTTEYIVILAIVVAFALKFKKTFSGQLDSIVGKLTGGINEAVSDLSTE